jgi:hypothetical protein
MALFYLMRAFSFTRSYRLIMPLSRYKNHVLEPNVSVSTFWRPLALFLPASRPTRQGMAEGKEGCIYDPDAEYERLLGR